MHPLRHLESVGKAKRRFYKPERKPTRKKGVLEIDKQAPVGCLDANRYEIAMALYSLCRAATDAEIEIGRGGSYDPIRDEYTVTGKINGKAQDMTIEGVAVAALINQLRLWNATPQFDKHALTR